MNMKVKDFAAQQGVSESIVYRHIRQHKDELGNRVIKQGKATWLTDEGQEYIRGLMVQQPVVLHNNIAEVQDFRAKLEDKQNKIELLQGFLLDAKDEIKALTDEKYALIAENRRIALLEAENVNKSKELALAQQEAQTASDELTAARAELETLRKENDKLRNRKWYQMIFNKE